MQQVSHPKLRLLVLYGPTVIGKTRLAIKLAKKFNGEIISADSRQVYRGLNIGTGKVDFKSKVEKQSGYWIVDGIKIFGFDIVNPGGKFSVLDYIKYARRQIVSISKQGKLPIIVGGTGFYIKTLHLGLGSAGLKPNLKLRKKLDDLSPKELLQILSKINRKKALSMNKSDQLNPRRLIRAIEIEKAVQRHENTNLSEPINGDTLLIGLTAPNGYIFKKADSWLEERLKRGLVAEVESLKREINPEWLISLGLEYKWATLLLEGKLTKQEAINKLKGDIHNFIRRQKTWFSQLKDIKIYDITNKLEMESLEKTISLWYTQANERRE
jgi:tRNA dimethylallyltransferase